MKEEKLQAFINESNMIVQDMNCLLMDMGVIDKYYKKKKYLANVTAFASKDEDFFADVFDVGMRTLLMDHLIQREHCKKCTDKACEEGAFE